MTTSLITMTESTGSVSIASDPSRFNERLCDGSIVALSRARREIVATFSAIIGGHRRIEAHHNDNGEWAVLIDDEMLATTAVLMWSTMTVDALGYRVHVTRGQALSTLVHEAMHILYTDDVAVPRWLQDPAHVDPFHVMLNFAEDVRIEDLGETVVPAFANLRRDENDRLISPNVSRWHTFDIVRKVCLVLFAERSCTDGASDYANHIAADPDVATLLNQCRPSFVAATQASDTATVRDRLREMYEFIAPYLPNSNGSGTGPVGDQPGGTVPPPPGGDGSDGESHDEDENTETGEGTGTNENSESDDSNTDGGSSGKHESQDADQQDEDEDDAPDNGDIPEDGGTIHDPSWQDDVTIKPNAPRGKWEDLIPHETRPDEQQSSRHDDVMNGDAIADSRYELETDTTVLDSAHESGSSVRLRTIKSLRRVLQDNANGGWSTRRKTGTFYPKHATRLALGDTRTFRRKRGARGSLDYSLVLCLDGSGSVSGVVGESIATAGLAVYEAASKIHGLDTAMCVYGHGIHFALPFDATIRDVARDGSYNRLRISNLLNVCHHGMGGSTAEDWALTWAVATTQRRAADSRMIIVLTDGAPNNRWEATDIIKDAHDSGIRTGGIGVLHPAPTYHEFATSVDALDELPNALADLIKTMMKAR